jgi:RNA polymerase sigma factor (sigma-70 family)
MQEDKAGHLNDAEIITKLEGINITPAIELLYENFLNTIVDFVIFTGGNKEDGADIFQESIMVLIEQVRSGKFRGESNLKTFLLKIARNLWMMELRTIERRKKREEDFYSDDPVFLEEINLNKKLINLQPILNKVGQICKNILVGYYFENKSMKVLLNDFDFKNEQVLRNKKNLCMKRLKKLLKADTTLYQTLKNEFTL